MKIIKIDDSLHERLMKLGNKGDTFNDIISSLADLGERDPQ